MYGVFLNSPWMNEQCTKCKYFSQNESTSQYQCANSDSYNQVIAFLGHEKGLPVWASHPSWYSRNEQLERQVLPCFYPKPKIPSWRLPVAILLGIVLTPICIFGLFLGIGIGSGMSQYDRLPWPISVILILIGCCAAVAIAVFWYRKQIWQDLWKK